MYLTKGRHGYQHHKKPPLSSPTTVYQEVGTTRWLGFRTKRITPQDKHKSTFQDNSAERKLYNKSNSIPSDGIEFDLNIQSFE